MLHRASENAIWGVPALLAAGAKTAEDLAPGAGGTATLGTAIVAVVGLGIRLYFQDRQSARTEKTAQLNSEVARLAKQVETLQDRNSLVVYTPPDLGERKAGRTYSIIVAEDHDGLGFTEAKTLRMAGHRVRLCKTVGDAIREYNAEPPDAIVVDLKLSDGDGEIVIKHARRQGLPCHVVVVTGEVDETRLAKVRKLGARVLVKPVNGDALLEAIRPDPTDVDLPVLPPSDSGIIQIPKA